MNTKSTRRLK